MNFECATLFGIKCLFQIHIGNNMLTVKNQIIGYKKDEQNFRVTHKL